MIIEGVKLLDQNYYETITVRDGVIKVGGKLLNTIHMNKSFTESLRGKTDEEIRVAVIEYFMNYNKLNYVSNDFSRITGYMSYAGSESGKLLIIDDKISEEEKTKILNKYIRDRYSFLYNHPCDVYGLNVNYGDTSSYAVSRSGSVKFNLAQTNNKLPIYENAFIEEFLDQVFGNEIIEVVKPKKYEEHVSNYKLVGNDKVVILGMMNKEIMKKVDEHNKKCARIKKENEDALIMQLKMEGF